MNAKRLALAAILAMALTAPAPALAWGNAPTHFSMGYELVRTGAVPISAKNYMAFVQAAAAPDLAWTPLFRATGLTYVHSEEFAESLLTVAQKNNNEKWLGMAYSWGAHLAEDAIGHGSYIPEAEPLHSLVEVAVDTGVFYDHFPLPDGFTSWAQINVGFDTDLLFRASVDYLRNGHLAPLVWPWEAAQALKGLKNSINAEYSYINLKGDASLSLAYLTYLAEKGILPSPNFIPFYEESVNAAADWITPDLGQVDLAVAVLATPSTVPEPATMLLLGSGLILLAASRKKFRQ